MWLIVWDLVVKSWHNVTMVSLPFAILTLCQGFATEAQSTSYTNSTLCEKSNSKSTSNSAIGVFESKKTLMVTALNNLWVQKK